MGLGVVQADGFARDGLAGLGQGSSLRPSLAYLTNLVKMDGGATLAYVRSPLSRTARNVRIAAAITLLGITAVTGGAAQGLPAGRSLPLGMDAGRLRRIDSVMQAFVDSGRVAGVVTLVARHGRVVQSGAYGMADREAGRRMTTGALFRIASQTKAVTSVAVMILVEAGRLRLDDPVSRLAPSFAHATVASGSDTGLVRTPVARAITIRDLLTHTAGITYGTWSFAGDTLVPALYRAAGLGPAAGYGWYFADKAEPICASIDRLGTLPFYSQPGRAFVYGYNTDILGCVVERVSGMSLDAFISSRILRPLRMHDTHFFVPPAQRDRLTAVYAARNDGTFERAPEGPLGQGSYVDGPRTSFSGGAGLVSTAGDYARFLQMLLNAGELDGARILSPRTVALMTADQIDSVYGTRGMGFGLGFEILEDPGLAGRFGAPGAYGWGGAYGSNYWVDPAEGLVAVFMIQLMPRGDLDLADRFHAMVYGAMTNQRTPR